MIEALADTTQDTLFVQRLASGNLTLDYYTAQPAPTQWIAVGMVTLPALTRQSSIPPSLMVGTGDTEEQAIRDLRQRAGIPLPPRYADEFFSEWTIVPGR